MASVITAIMFGILLVPVENVIQNCTSDHGIQFIEQPNNTKVCLNGTAYFSCSYSGTSIRPNWMINSSIYPSNNLPSNTRYDAITDTLIVNNITVDQNNETYQCFFPFLNGNEPCDVLSSIGRLQLYSLAPDACICQEDEKNVCSCFQDSVIVSISEDSHPASSEDFAIRIQCHSNFSETVGLEIRTESSGKLKFNPQKNNFTCRNGVMLPHNQIVCAVVDNLTVSYDISVHITSFENEPLTNICLLDAQKYVMELSGCQPSIKLQMLVIGVVLSVVTLVVIAAIIAPLLFIIRRRYHYKTLQGDTIKTHTCTDVPSYSIQQNGST